MLKRKKQAVSAYSNFNTIEFVNGGKSYFDLLIKLINQSVHSIHLQTYIFDYDETGLIISSALIAASKRGVQVYLLVDGYASQGLSKKLIKQFKEVGIHFRFFEPIFKSKHFYFGRRLHHKIFVSDEKYAVVSGRNIADRYNDLPGKMAWLDFGLFVEGNSVKEICILCWKTWKGFPVKMEITPCEKNEGSFDFKSKELVDIRMRRNDWVRRKKEISATYIEMIRNAQSHITIICSYFLPGKIIRKLLKAATERGVKIKLITAGPSDVMVAKRAERWMYDWLLRNKIEIYEYQPTVLHAKVAVCDSKWFTIGSYNVNNISAYASIELNLDIRNDNFSGKMELILDNIIKDDCIPITVEELTHSKNIIKQFIRWCSYQFIRLSFFLFTFYYKQIS